MSFPMYKQTDPEACGAACLMMVLRHFSIKKFPGKGELIRAERKYYQLYGARACKGTLAAGLAHALQEVKLDPVIFHGSSALLENRDGYFPDAEYAAILAEHRADIEKYALTVRIRPVTAALIREELEKGRMVIAQVFVEGNADGVHDHVMHWVVVFSTDGDNFRVADPSPEGGKRLLTADELDSYLQTPFGGCCISVGKEQP